MNKQEQKMLLEKWGDVLDLESVPSIKNHHKKLCTAIMLENQVNHLQESTSWGYGSMDPNNTGYMTGSSGDGVFHQIAVPMVRRTFPELLAHEIVGVQPLTGPVGIAFALRYKAQQTYNGATGTEVGHNTIDSDYSFSGTSTPNTSAAEALGSKAGSGVGNDVGIGVGAGNHIYEIGMTLEKSKVEANTRKLRSRWSLEVAQDVKAMHGINLEEEMMDILAYEITAEIDRELITSIKTACVATSAGWNYSAADGRWESEKYRNLYNRIVRDANNIAITTRRGAGNFIIAEPTVCSGLESMANFSIHPINNDLNTAVVGVSKLGSLDGRMMVYRDTFASVAEYIIGYKGISAYDTGIVYLPYIQLLSSRSTFEDSFNPAIGLMSRYAIHSNIFGAGNYYRHVRVHNLPT